MKAPAYDELVQRNIGVLSEDGQATLRRATVAVAGLGGVGGLVAERLARLGVGRLHLADNDVFEVSNLNRQLGAGLSTVGQEKANVLERLVRDANPYARVRCWREGVGEANVAEFAAADVIVDCVDYQALASELTLHARAQQDGTPVVVAQAIGFGGTVTVCMPHALSLAEGLEIGGGLTDFDGGLVARMAALLCPRLPAYLDPAVVSDVIAGRRGMPTTSLGVLAAAALAQACVIRLLLGGTDALPVLPAVARMDPFEAVGG